MSRPPAHADIVSIMCSMQTAGDGDFAAAVAVGAHCFFVLCDGHSIVETAWL